MPSNFLYKFLRIIIVFIDLEFMMNLYYTFVIIWNRSLFLLGLQMRSVEIPFFF